MYDTFFSRFSATALDEEYVSPFFWPQIRSGFVVVFHILAFSRLTSLYC